MSKIWWRRGAETPLLSKRFGGGKWSESDINDINWVTVNWRSSVSRFDSGLRKIPDSLISRTSHCILLKRLPFCFWDLKVLIASFGVPGHALSHSCKKLNHQFVAVIDTVFTRVSPRGAHLILGSQSGALILPPDIKILGWCPAGLVLPHEEVPF